LIKIEGAPSVAKWLEENPNLVLSEQRRAELKHWVLSQTR
jgi:hypothetical protein